MLSAPFYFSLGLGISFFFLVVFLLLVYLSVRIRANRPVRTQTQSKQKLILARPELNARVSGKSPMAITDSQMGKSVTNRLSPDFNPDTYHRVKKLLEEKKDIKAIAQQEKLSLGEVRLIASLNE